LKQAGFVLVVVSNQSGVGRGLIPSGALVQIHQRLQDLLRSFDVTIDHFELCFHRPEEECECRKPKPKLILDAAQKLGIHLPSSYMVGDKRSDIEAGQAAGCKASLLVRTGEGRNTEKNWGPSTLPQFMGDSLGDVASWILGQFSK
jgi:histidinol-phosphate phosphatase family protein